MSLATATFRNPRLVALALLVIVSAGLSALFALGRQEDPSITNLFATITTVYPGADPARIETLVTKPIEDEMRSRPEVKEIKSVSSTGISVVSLELDETTDPGAIEQIWSKARDGLSDVAASFPAGAMAPEFDSDGIAAFGAILALTPSAGDVLPGIQARYAEELADRMRNVPGTKLVELFGLPQEEVLVSVDPARAAALGLSADAIAQAIRQGDAKVQAGRVLDGQSDLILDVAGDIQSLDRLRRIVLAEDGQSRVTQLGAIATLTRGAKEPQDSYALSAGRPAILLGLQISDGLQVDQWMAWVQDELAAFQDGLPPSLTATQIFDQADYTRQRLTEVAINMAIGIALVITVLLFTLGARSALIVAAVLPLVSLATLASMNVIGLPIHQMSVTGLIVALGLLVDAAIVMTDEVRQRLLKGIERSAAVADAVRRLAVPLLASTVTTALSFVPMILLPGGAGDFVGAIAIAVVLMLVWSLIIAVTITPALAGWLLPASGRAGRFSNGLRSGRLGRIFRASLTWSLRHPIKSVALALVLPVTGFASMGTLTAQFFPGVDRDQFHIEIELAPGTSILQT
ncbi:MAG: efflux RND transporter permease subunit, partial [Alphaproteobacteria bacterium]|nr:efflux RND transporter permease subunit [Alphaproteobacteria bacterium]